MFDTIIAATPDNLEQTVGAIVTILLTAVLTYLRGRKVGHDRAIDGKD